MAKEYKLSNGMELRNPNEFCYTVSMDWCGRTVGVSFLLDEDSIDGADNSVALFESVFAKREYYIMMARHILKNLMINDAYRYSEVYEQCVDKYRRHPELVWNPGLFDELLMETSLETIKFGNSGEMEFTFYNNSENCSYTLMGTENQGFFDISVDEDYDEDYDEDSDEVSDEEL